MSSRRSTPEPVLFHRCLIHIHSFQATSVVSKAPGTLELCDVLLQESADGEPFGTKFIQIPRKKIQNDVERCFLNHHAGFRSLVEYRQAHSKLSWAVCSRYTWQMKLPELSLYNHGKSWEHPGRSTFHHPLRFIQNQLPRLLISSEDLQFLWSKSHPKKPPEDPQAAAPAILGRSAAGAVVAQHLAAQSTTRGPSQQLQRLATEGRNPAPRKQGVQRTIYTLHYTL